MRPTLALTLLLLACAPEEQPPAPTITYDRRQEIRIVAEPLESAIARGIIDLPKASSRETRDSGWSYAFIERPPIAGRDTVRHPFQLRIDNRRDTVRFFDATIDYFDPSGATVRTRALRRLMVPPFTRHTYEGEAAFPADATITTQAAVRPIEPE
ncbi:MAG: hypothetical protein ACYC7A_22120 [Thermoanaerobaculia bacterium]